MSQALIGKNPEAVEGLLLTDPLPLSQLGERGRKFVRDYRAINKGEKPDVWSGFSYDAVKMIADAIARAGEDRGKIRDHLAATDSMEKAFHGITGATYFDEKGDCVKALSIAVVKSGEFQPAPKQPKY